MSGHLTSGARDIERRRLVESWVDLALRDEVGKRAMVTYVRTAHGAVAAMIGVFEDAYPERSPRDHYDLALALLRYRATHPASKRSGVIAVGGVLMAALGIILGSADGLAVGNLNAGETLVALWAFVAGG